MRFLHPILVAFGINPSRWFSPRYRAFPTDPRAFFVDSSPFFRGVCQFFFAQISEWKTWGRWRMELLEHGCWSMDAGGCAGMGALEYVMRWSGCAGVSALERVRWNGWDAGAGALKWVR